MLEEIAQAFERLRIRDHWYTLGQPIMSRLRDISDTTTYELEASLTSATIMFKVIACTHELSPTVRGRWLMELSNAGITSYGSSMNASRWECA